ncbi:Hypothetical predicted protein [Podarcis lilfordi]|uniref:Uncharacterized protein n=1 Tax=Podarcis lilfordi TaxID=74358 RepID=A0AA35LDL7_9SAUR|nr:Hypothetical predicted protein [Podarcis lilfordi]
MQRRCLLQQHSRCQNSHPTPALKFYRWGKWPPAHHPEKEIPLLSPQFGNLPLFPHPLLASLCVAAAAEAPIHYKAELTRLPPPATILGQAQCEFSLVCWLFVVISTGLTKSNAWLVAFDW